MILWSAERWRRPKYFPTYAAAARTICNTLLICVLRCIGASSYFKMLAAVAVVRSMYYLNVVSISTYSNKENRMVRMKNEATKFGLPLMSMYSGLELQINCKCTKSFIILKKKLFPRLKFAFFNHITVIIIFLKVYYFGLCKKIITSIIQTYN